jgi:hypothetical protein
VRPRAKTHPQCEKIGLLRRFRGAKKRQSDALGTVRKNGSRKAAKVFVSKPRPSGAAAQGVQFSTAEIFIRKEGDDVTLSPRPCGWGPHLETASVASEGFIKDVEDLPSRSAPNEPKLQGRTRQRKHDSRQRRRSLEPGAWQAGPSGRSQSWTFSSSRTSEHLNLPRPAHG